MCSGEAEGTHGLECMPGRMSLHRLKRVSICLVDVLAHVWGDGSDGCDGLKFRNSDWKRRRRQQQQHGRIVGYWNLKRLCLCVGEPLQNRIESQNLACPGMCDLFLKFFHF